MPLAENVQRFLSGRELDAGYDGHANCFIESGFHKALLIDFNYETEPLPGHFPGALGLPLLRESRLNHLGKLAFQWVYWHALIVDPAGHRLAIVTGDEVIVTRTLPADLTIEAVPPPALTVRFEPYGVSNGGDFRVQSGPVRYRVVVDGLTGHARATRE